MPSPLAGRRVPTTPTAIVTAPTGGGQGVGQPVSADHPFPTTCISGCAAATAFTPSTSPSLTAGVSSLNVALPAGGTVILVNSGTVDLFYKLGTTSGVTATTSDLILPAGRTLPIGIGSNTYIAAVTASGTAKLYVVGGTSTANFGGSAPVTVTLSALAIDQTTPSVTNGVVVNNSSLPLPSGASTLSAQNTANTSLSSIDTKLSSQSTAANQTTANSSLSSIDTKLSSQSTAANQTSANTKLDQLHTDAIAATPAGENHVGEVGGNQITIQVPQTVTASSAYASGNAVGGLMTIASAARVSTGSGLLQSVTVNSKSTQSTQFDIFVFNANPSASTCVDKTAFSLAAADFDKVIGVVSVTTWFAAGTPSIGQAQNLALPFNVASGVNLYGCAVTRSTPTFTATSDISLGYRILRN
jgi:hypothetical protein